MRLLAGVEVASIDEALGRYSGALLGQTGANDVLDAALIVLVADGGMVLTSEPDDIVDLARAAGVHGHAY